MAWLYPLRVNGLGSANIEALSSYIIRLAHAHAVAPGVLLTELLQRFSVAGPTRGLNVLRASISTLIRPNGSTQVLLEALAAGLAQASYVLEPTTFIALRGALERSQNGFAPRLRWCPACLNAQMANGDEPYYMLAWQVLAVDACAAHRIRLRDRCAHCGGTQDSFQHRRSLAECVRCGEPLDHVTREDLRDEVDSSDLTSLVTYVAEHPDVRFPAKGVNRAVKALFDHAWGAGEEAALYRILPRDECIRFANPDEVVTLSSALRIAFRLNVPIVDLLSGQLRGTNRSILCDMREALPGGIAPRSRRKIPAAEILRRDVRRVLAAAPTPLPLREVARRLGVSAGALRYSLPKESDGISQAFLSNKKRQRRKVLAQCRVTVASRLADWTSKSTCPMSKKGLLKLVRAQTGLPKNVLRKEITRAVSISSRVANEGESE